MLRKLIYSACALFLAATLPIAAKATSLTITAANVAYVSGPTIGDQVAGEAFAAGAILYKADDGKWYKAKSSGTAVQAGSRDIGMALNTTDAANARVTLAKHGAVVAIGTGTAGTIYVIGSTAGALAPVADLSSTNKVQPAAIGIGTNQVMLLHGYNAGAVVP